MFWESIPHGYVLLLDYRIWIAVILYGAGHWRFIILQQRYLLNLEGVTNVGLFKKKLFLVESVTDLINSLLVTLIVYFITPILIGGDSLMGLASTGTLITILFKSLLFGTIALLVLGFIPVVGDNTGTRFFALGIISLVIILGNHEIRDEVYHFSGDINNIAIGPWQLVGYLYHLKNDIPHLLSRDYQE